MFGKLKSIRIALTVALTLMVGSLQAQTISGNVKDANGEPVIGATIMESGTKNGTVTDFDGNFTIKLQQGGNLDVTYIGMKPQKIKTAGKTNVNITLEDDNTTLNDVVVVGYGTMKKSDLTGSVSSVNTEQLNAKGQSSVLGNLQGSTPGVNITQSGSRVGGDFNVEIRGRSSINSDTKPIYVVDGVISDDINWLNPQDIEKIDVLKDASSTAIYGSQATAGVVMVTTKSGANVKKEAKATISYDGYFGWTKTARMPDFMNAEQFYKYRFLKFMLPVDNTNSGNINYMNENIAQCLLQTPTGYLLNEMIARGESYNWPDIVTKGGSQQNHYLAVNGSADKVNYHFGIGYNGEKGIYENDTKKQISFKGSIDAQINKYLTSGFTVNLARIENTYANDRAVQEAYSINSFVSPYYKTDFTDANGVFHPAGSVIHRPAAAEALGTVGGNQFSGNTVNPLDIMRNTDEERTTWRALGNFYIEVKPIKGLSIKSTFSPNYTNYRHGYYYGYTDYEDGGTHFYGDVQNASTSTSTIYTTREKFSWTWDNVVTYNTRFADKHNLNVMGLFSSQKNTDEQNIVNYTELIEGTKWYATQKGTYNADESKGTSYSANTMTSWALRANYGFMDRYLLTATVRWDGSSKFAEGNRWGCFPSVAFAWRASEEEFIKKINWISNLKLRVSYGVTGNNKGVGNYATVVGLSSTMAYYPFGTQYYTGMRASAVVDKDIKWEKSGEFNLGIDFGFLKNRIMGSIDFYTKKSKDLLADVNLPLEAGGGKIYTNIGSVRNTGVELSLTTVNVKTKDWEWTTTYNLAHNKNKVLETIGQVDPLTGQAAPIIGELPTGNYFVGESANNIYTWEVGGIVSDRYITVPDNTATRNAGLVPGATMKESDYFQQAWGVKEGQPYVIDQNNDGIIDANDKKVFDADPSVTMSLSSNLTWKNWDFGMSLYAKLGGYAYSSFFGGDSGSGSYNSAYVNYADRGVQHFNMDYYIPAGTLIGCDGVNADGTYINPRYQETTQYGEYPFPNNGINNGLGPQKTYWNQAKGLQKIGYLKVQNMTLGYTFPKKWLSSWGCSYLRLYFTVTNPIVITKYKGFDPEWAGASRTADGPSTVAYQIGASIKF